MKLSKPQQSILAIAAGLFVVAWLKHSPGFLIAGLIITATIPFRLLHEPIHHAWMFISKILGWISSHIILTILFYLFLTPIAFIRRWLGHQDMKVFSQTGQSAFDDRNHIYEPTDFLNPW